MIKRLTPLLFALGTLPVLAQQTPKPDPTQAYSLLDGKTIIKTNPFSDIFGNLNLKVERIITDGLSAQLSVFASPKTNQGRQFGAFHDITSVTSSIALYSFQPNMSLSCRKYDGILMMAWGMASICRRIITTSTLSLPTKRSARTAL